LQDRGAFSFCFALAPPHNFAVITTLRRPSFEGVSLALPSPAMKLKITLALVLAASLAACGGGGDSGDARPADASTGNISSSTPGNAGGGTGTSGSSGSVASPALNLCSNITSVAEVLAKINAARTVNQSCGGASYAAVPPLAWSAKLALAAEAHSLDMATHNFFSHTGSNGSTEADRVAAAGYGYWMLGENIAAGQASVDEVLAAWLASPAHCANMMNSGFKEVGLSCGFAAGSQYQRYWTLELGAN
jgi:uncharacterized protein YkwD